MSQNGNNSHQPPQNFSDYFGLQKTQPELDFVDVPVNSDLPLFIDPFAISQRSDEWSINCDRTIKSYFQQLVDVIKAGKQEDALEMLRHLREPNETHLGFSSGRPKGAGIGHFQSLQIYNSLSESTAVKTGFLNSLEECEFMVEGIGHDKISDLTTNVLRLHLVKYTQDQCNLWSIPMQEAPLPPCYDSQTNTWAGQYHTLPIVQGKPIVLVPKVIARYNPTYDHHRYYRETVLHYLQVENLNANSSLVRTLKNGNRVVYKKDIKARFPCTKENIFKFCKEHPEALIKYRERLAKIEKSGSAAQVSREDEILLARVLAEALKAIPPGDQSATDYHNIMLGMVEFLFSPNLIYPIKEQEIHNGRKRIDITMENGAGVGIFHRLHDIRKLPSSHVAIECKNYNKDIRNPELDQLSGRFSVNRGKLGFLCCRKLDDRKLFIQRCRDTFKDDRGLIVLLEDETVINLLEVIEQRGREQLDSAITRLIDEVWYS